MKQLTIGEANEMILPGKTTEEYQKYYDYIIDLAEPRGLDKTKIEFYCEIHHRIPSCCGGSDNEDNLVALSFTEHLICHILLYFIYPEEKGLKIAAWNMIYGLTNAKNKHVINFTIDEFNNIISKIDISLLQEIRSEFIKSRSIPVVCYDNSNKIFGVWESYINASRDTGLSQGAITLAIKRKYKCGGYYWSPLEEYKKDNYENLMEFLEIPKENWPKINIPLKRSGTKYKVVCYSINTEYIYKIYDRPVDVQKDGFDPSTIRKAINRYDKRSCYKDGESQGFRWERLSEWKNKDELDNYYNKVNNNIIDFIFPYNLNTGILLISKSTNEILDIIESSSLAAKLYPGYNLQQKLNKGKDAMVSTPHGIFMKVRKYVELFEDRWLDYLRHKQQSNNNDTDAER